jgi:hypothetical protein
MPVEFLSDEQVGAYGRFTGELSAPEVERFIYLDDADRDLIALSRDLPCAGCRGSTCQDHAADVPIADRLPGNVPARC